MPGIDETKTAVEQALNDATGIDISATVEGETIQIEDADGNVLDVETDGSLIVSGTVDVNSLPEPLDVSGSTVTVTDNGLFTIDDISSTIAVQEDTPLDVSSATVTVTDNGSLSVSDIATTVSVQEDTPLDVSASTVTVTDNGALSINSLPEPVQTEGANAPNGTSSAVTVGTSSTQLLAASSTRQELLVQNLDGSNDIFVGFGSGVTTSDGARVAADGGTYVSEAYTGAVYAIATGSGTDVRVQEVTE